MNAPTGLPLRVQLLAYVLICAGIVASICVLVVAMGQGLSVVPFLPGVAVMTVGTAVAGVMLSRGSARSITCLKASFAFGGAAVVAKLAAEPLSALVAAWLTGIVVFALLHYLQRPDIRSALQPPPTPPAARVPPAVRWLALRLRSVGGVGLFLQGVLAALALAVSYAQLASNAQWDVRLGYAILLPYAVAIYPAPCIVLGILLWQDSAGRLAVLLGLSLSILSAAQLWLAGPVEILPVATSIALVFAILAPPTRRAYSARGSK